MYHQYFNIKRISVFVVVFLLFSCNKLVEIPEPKDTLTTTKVFSTDAQAQSAMAGLLSTMINGTAVVSVLPAGFSNGVITYLNGLSADELTVVASGAGKNLFNTNTLVAGVQDQIWPTAYRSIYDANAIIEGIEASKSPMLKQQTRVMLTAEAKFIRAFSYFYLVNTYGDVPLVLTTDFNKTVNLPRTAVATVYQQMINDLTDAANALPADYAAGGGERIRPNKWAAKALLARVYLFTGNNVGAIKESTDVITQGSLYQLQMGDLNQVFLKNSPEAIWQLQQNSENKDFGNATPEGYYLQPNSSGAIYTVISTELINAFEPGDLRRSAWTNSTVFPAGGNTTYIYPYKYKVGVNNRIIGAAPSVETKEYYMALRLAEQYLIRAEAAAINGQSDPAIDDLNVIRKRAGLGDLPKTLTRDALLAAVAKERQTELFVEWGHRWMDLKRTGKASSVLSAMPLKQPWLGDYQLLYPIPIDEIRKDHFLIQNPKY